MNRALLFLLGGLFVLTGATGLLFEQVFERLLTTVVGASTPAGAIVLAVYFLGLSLGGLTASTLLSKVSHPARLYGLLEGFVGLWAVTLLALSEEVLSSSARFVGLAGEQPALVLAARLAVASAWILPPTIAMGATFPVLVAALHRGGSPLLRLRMTRFYALNLLGAALGAISGPFLVFPALGLDGGLGLVASLQLGILVIALVLARLDQSEASDSPLSSRPSLLRTLRRAVADADRRLLLALGFLSGFVVFGLEVTWLHLIGTVVGMSVYAFGLMLTNVLLGLFFGGVVVSSLARARPKLGLSVLAVVLLASAVVVALTGALWDVAPSWLENAGASVSTFAAGERLRFSITLILVGAPSAVLGMTYPLIFRLPIFPEDDASSMSGAVGAANAMGSISGALLVGFLFIPSVGSNLTYHLLTLCLLVVAIAVALFDRKASGVRRPIHVVVAAVAIVVTAATFQQAPWDVRELTSGVNVYFERGFTQPSSEIVFVEEDTAGGFTTVILDRQGARQERTLLTNGKFQGNDSGEMVAQVSFALLPILHSDRRERALVIGLGTGVSARTVVDAGYRSVDVVEIAPGIIHAADKHFAHVNDRLLQKPNVNVIVEDGRNHLLRTNERYDLITMEISSIWFAGAASLYSEDFYRVAAARLRDDGVLQQWVQLHHMAPQEVGSTIATLRKVFPYVRVFFAGNQGILVASRAPLEFRDDVIASLSQRPELAFELGLLRAFRLTPDKLRDTLVLDVGGVDRLLEASEREGVVINDDRNRFLEYATPRRNVERVEHIPAVLRWLLSFTDEHERKARLRALGL